MKRIVLGLILGSVVAEAVVIPSVVFLHATSDTWNLVFLVWGIVCGCAGSMFVTARLES